MKGKDHHKVIFPGLSPMMKFCLNVPFTSSGLYLTIFWGIIKHDFSIIVWNQIMMKGFSNRYSCIVLNMHWKRKRKKKKVSVFTLVMGLYFLTCDFKRQHDPVASCMNVGINTKLLSLGLFIQSTPSLKIFCSLLSSLVLNYNYLR